MIIILFFSYFNASLFCSGVLNCWGRLPNCVVYTTLCFLTHSRPGQSHDNARRGDIIHSIYSEDGFTNVVLQNFRCDLHCALLAIYNAEGNFAENLKAEVQK